MKKAVASILMVTSLGVMASPSHCLLDWAKTQGAHPGRWQQSNVPKWGPKGSFEYKVGNTYTMGYEILVKNVKAVTDDAASGPWHCHCTLIKRYPVDDGDGPVHLTGVCSTL